jgi:ribosomal protein S18 acetylase RimI-like enzyme
VSEAPARALAIARAALADAAPLATLAASALPEAEAWSEPGFAVEIAAPQARVWVARSPGGALVGYLVAHRVLDELQLLSIAVEAAARRRGVGRALIEGALASEPGLRSLQLEVRADDPGAQAFYARLGFRALGRRPGFYAGGVDALLLGRDLA